MAAHRHLSLELGGPLQGVRHFFADLDGGRNAGDLETERI
jgi:hypothetical protein